MKTEKFDEEFRRKLLGLPAEADPGEVERILSFVNANGPSLPNLGWGKLLLYGGSSLLLLGSLSYNIFQTYRNTNLQSSLDSLTHRPVGRVMSSEVIRHDTVYITQSGPSKALASESVPGIAVETGGYKLGEPSNSNQSDEIGRKRSLVTGNTKYAQSGHEDNSSQPEASSSRSVLRSTTPLAAPAQPVGLTQRRKRSNQIRPEADSLITTSPLTTLDRFLMGTVNPAAQTARISRPAPTEGKGMDNTDPNGGPAAVSRSTTRRVKKGPRIISSFDRTNRLVTNHSSKHNHGTIDSPPTTGFTAINTDHSTLSVSISDVNRQPIIAEPLASLPLRTALKPVAIFLPRRSLTIPKGEFFVKTTRRSWHLTRPRLSVPSAQYRIGAGLTGGSDQVGGALLGEIWLTRRWSVLAGLQLGYNQGFRYRNEQEFNEYQIEDFRQTYASQVPLTSDIQDIKQISLLIQAPIQLAYHYPLGRQWGLRFGIGTNLTLWVRNAVSYNYWENSRSPEHGSSIIRKPTYVLDNLILSTSLERPWKKWLLRAGPFISPQLRPVSYKPEDLSWGANLQVLYRLGK